MTDDTHTAAAHHESSDVNVGGVLGAAIVLVVAAVVIHVLVAWLYISFKHEAARPAPLQYPLAERAMRRLPPEPRLQTDPREDLENLRQAEDHVLETYGWVDRDAGIVRIPIARAMALTVERGLPARPATEALK